MFAHTFFGVYKRILQKLSFLPSHLGKSKIPDHFFYLLHCSKKIERHMIDKNVFFHECLNSKRIQCFAVPSKNYSSLPIISNFQSISDTASKSLRNDNQDENKGEKTNKHSELLVVKNSSQKRKSKKNEDEIVPNSNKFCLRTHTCGELNDSHVGQKVRLMGWVEFLRMNKFVLLRDAYGRVQLIIPESKQDLQVTLKNLSLESVLEVEGTVRLRPCGQENLKQKTGFIEIEVINLKILSKAKVLPFNISRQKRPHESLRMKYRYLDLRHEYMQNNLRMRSKLLHNMRCYLIEKLDFVEVETPTLFKSTPGGAKEFLVPTQNEGKFYSLVQSPQQFKQLLMIGSLDRYFQVARCYRDEPHRNDRQPEFTQLDLEMSFCEREHILNLIEDLLQYCWPSHLPPLVTPFPRLLFEEAIDFYGTDKPDLRFDLRFKNLTNLFNEEKNNCKGSIKLNKYSFEDDFAVVALLRRKEPDAQLSKTLKSAEKELTRDYSDIDFIFLEITSEENAEKKLASLFCSEISNKIKKIVEYEVGDIICLAIGSKFKVMESLRKVRTKFSMEKAKIMEKNTFNFVWILDFPLFEVKNNQMYSIHHPFTQPHPEDFHLLNRNPLQVRGLNFDLVLNGTEVGGGSMRIQDSELQKLILQMLKIDSDSIFYLMEALASGAPPHGGIALGLDRLVAILCGAESIREVIAFPKSGRGNDPMSGAPCNVANDVKKFYHIL